ncbi:MAG: hypothetical protein P8R42_04745 [Candidatus Binatia bacterium]|nr:hypothetical protein [Candidatus Binatia bacterium]
MAASAKLPGALLAVAMLLADIRGLPPLKAHAKPDLQAYPPAYQYLDENREGRTLLELPLMGAAPASTRIRYRTRHWLRRFDGYSGSPTPTIMSFSRFTRKLPAPQPLQGLLNRVEVEWRLPVDLGKSADHPSYRQTVTAG